MSANPKSNNNNNNTFSFTVAKTLIALAAVGLFVSGWMQISAHNNSLVVYFHDKTLTKYKTEYFFSNTTTTNNSDNATNSQNNYYETSQVPDGLYYDDTTTTIFLDGWICYSGNCSNLDDNIWSCDTMRREIRQTRNLSIACGSLMIVSSFLMFLSLLSRGIGAMIFGFLQRMCSSSAFVSNAYPLVPPHQEEVEELEIEKEENPKMKKLLKLQLVLHLLAVTLLDIEFKIFSCFPVCSSWLLFLESRST
jgi:hypothetical protein